MTIRLRSLNVQDRLKTWLSLILGGLQFNIVVLMVNFLPHPLPHSSRHYLHDANLAFSFVVKRVEGWSRMEANIWSDRTRNWLSFVSVFHSFTIELHIQPLHHFLFSSWNLVNEICWILCNYVPMKLTYQNKEQNTSNIIKMKKTKPSTHSVKFLQFIFIKNSNHCC